MKLLLSLFFFSLSSFVYSQSISTSTTSSRCQNSGTITVTISGGTPAFTYTITGGPTGTSAPTYPVVISSSNTSETFTSLIPGTYNISVDDASGTHTASATITGSYTEPRFDLQAEDVKCGGATDGKLFVSNARDGRPVYNYQIISPAAHASTLQTSDTFHNLPAGTYQVRMYDSCGNFQTRTATIADNYRAPNIWRGQNDTRTSCDSANLYVRPFNGKLPYMLRVIDPTNSSNYIDSLSVSSVGYYAFNLPIYYPGTSTTSATNYVFEVTDACGRTKRITNKFEIQNSATTAGTCDGFTFTYGTTATTNALMGDTLWLTISPDPLGISPMPFKIVDGVSIALDSIPYGSYSYSIVSDCDTITGTFSESVTPFDSIQVQILSESCGPNMARLKVEPYGRPDGTFTTQIWRGSTLVNTKYHDEKGFTQLNIPSDSVEYTLVMWNQCDDTVRRTILVDTTVVVSQNYSTSVFCGGGGNVHVGSSILNSTTTGRFYRLHDLAGSEIKRTLTHSDTATWTNITPGTYVVSTLYAGYYGLSASYCESTKDTFELVGYEYPSIDAVSTQCTGGTLSTEVTEVIGAGPFTYYLRDQATLSTIRGPSTQDTFQDLTSGIAYNILVVDSCGNTANANVSPRAVDTTLALIGSAVCEHSPITIYTDTFISTDYSWTGPNSFTSTENSITFDPVQMSDTGEYILTANVLNGCLIYTDTVMLQVNPLTKANADDLTVATCYSASGTGIFDSAVAIVNSNLPSVIETLNWEILSTPPGGEYIMKDSTSSPLHIKLTTPGDYEAIFNINSTNGCYSADTVIIRSNCNAYLPVTMTKFEGRRDQEDVLLEWSTASEKNVDGYQVHRLSENLQWEKIGFVRSYTGNSQSQTSYRYNDPDAPSNKTYYKLISVDFDGSKSEIDPIYVDAIQVNSAYVYPNPANSRINVVINFDTVEDEPYTVYNLAGQVQLKGNFSKDKSRLDINGFEKGIYLMRISNTVIRFVKL